MTELCFRFATLADVPRLRALVESAYRGASAKRGWTHEADLLDGDRTSDDELASLIADPDKRVLLAEDAIGALAGSVNATNLGNGRAYMGMLCVDPELQSDGLGRALIAAIEAVAVREFAASVMEMTVVDARPELIAYYERRGYVRTPEVRPFPLPIAVPFAMAVLERAIG
ncbi:GNAT family N-acetyltransferase [Novosphingobium sp. FKTRR1]|uniref:GNAT family N-acetyltransferase n=1 Tax=Novosphingobium sp. FKTRR1 TaxID=2879118 RepID=UPI001CEFF7F2|nr:GNAT family N-acetyltransferase [Novosphingobium sp. FKTRR1]